jgi:hypothetical protein
MVFEKFLDSEEGKIIISIVWGLGIAALFRKACKGRSCIVVKGPDPSELKDKVFAFNNKCYTYTPYATSCKSHGNIPT